MFCLFSHFLSIFPYPSPSVHHSFLLLFLHIFTPFSPIPNFFVFPLLLYLLLQLLLLSTSKPITFMNPHHIQDMILQILSISRSNLTWYYRSWVVQTISLLLIFANPGSSYKFSLQRWCGNQLEVMHTYNIIRSC